MLSKLLLDSLQEWERIDVSGQLFHGCHADDRGIDIRSYRISGNKWFSSNPFYAGQYCWHFSRPDVGERYRASVSLAGKLIGLLRPRDLQEGSFPYFLKECFPEIPPSYQLSRHFQDNFAAHVQEILPNQAVCYVSGDGEEVLIPSCERHLKSIEFARMPDTKSEYLRLNGLV